jgi:hypothetical protein
MKFFNAILDILALELCVSSLLFRNADSIDLGLGLVV